MKVNYNLQYCNEEWIDGVQYMAPRPNSNHSEILSYFSGLFWNYFKNSLCKFKQEPDLFLTTENIDDLLSDANKLNELYKDKKANVVPDIVVICNRNQITYKGVIGVPSLILEVVSPNNASHDTIRKLKLYEKYGVPEYWIIDPMTKKTYLWVLEKGRYELKIESDFKDKFTSSNFTDLEVDLSEIEIIEEP